MQTKASIKLLSTCVVAIVSMVHSGGASMASDVWSAGPRLISNIAQQRYVLMTVVIHASPKCDVFLYGSARSLGTTDDAGILEREGLQVGEHTFVTHAGSPSESCEENCHGTANITEDTELGDTQVVRLDCTSPSSSPSRFDP